MAWRDGLGPRRGTAVALAFILLLSGCASDRRADRGPPPSARGADLAGVHGPKEFDPPRPAPDFTLADTDGRPFRLSRQKGRFVLLLFGYTTCPDVCPATLSNLRTATILLGRDADRLRVVFVTVDPERDTPERLGAYLRLRGDGRFTGLTGRKEDLAPVWAAYGALAQKEEASGGAAGYWVTHNADTYVIDPGGRLVASYPFGTSGQEIAADLRRRF